MIEIVPSIMVQGHSAASTMKDTFNVPMAVSGVILAVLAALVVFGGVKRIASFAEKLYQSWLGFTVFGF